MGASSTKLWHSNMMRTKAFTMSGLKKYYGVSSLFIIEVAG